MIDGWGFGGGGIGLGSAGTVDSPYAWLLARVTPIAPIAIQLRGDLTATLLDDLTQLAPPRCSMSLAALYVISPSGVGAYAESARRPCPRLDSFLRWGITIDTAAPGAILQAKVASKHIRRAYTSASAMLGQRYQLKPVISATCDAALRAEVAARRFVELDYAEWGTPAAWMAPMQVRPALDLLLRQPDFAAIQFTIESRAEQPEEADADEEDRVVGEERGDERGDERDVDERDADGAARPQYFSHITALGAATDGMALRLLENELRGQGVLTVKRARDTQPPLVRVMRPCSPEDEQRVARNLIGPAARASNPAEQVTYNRWEAVTLFPLPFKAD